MRRHSSPSGVSGLSRETLPPRAPLMLRAQSIQEELGEKGSLAQTQIALADVACDARHAEDAVN